jgi:hypothetical protein
MIALGSRFSCSPEEPSFPTDPRLFEPTEGSKRERRNVYGEAPHGARKIPLHKALRNRLTDTSQIRRWTIKARNQTKLSLTNSNRAYTTARRRNGKNIPTHHSVK